MKLKPLIIITILFITTSCKSQSIAPTVTVTPLPTETALPSATATPLPTETLLPTETPSPVPTPSDVFGAIPLNSVQAFTLEPVAKAIFEQALQGYVSAGKIQEFRVDSISVFPSSNGTLIAEIMYSIHAENDPWMEDFGTLGTDGWITGKCSRFDLIATDTEQQLKNKRLCS
jgi:hypothetical protein